jgi:uncharacterized protein (UPF0261 family)
MSVVLIGTLDTKGDEVAFARDLLVSLGFKTIVVDAGSAGVPSFRGDVPRDEVFRRAGTSLAEIEALGDRASGVERAARGVAAFVCELAERGELEGVLGLGGSAGTTIATAAMRPLPFGLPKIVVSTLASGQTRPFIEGADVVLFPAVADIAGLNRITRKVIASAVAALAGMIEHKNKLNDIHNINQLNDRAVIAATMFGVTTRCVDRARRGLEERGFEPIVFHATGVGGRAMERMIQEGGISGVLDLTTTELADELAGGILSAGPDRLEAAGRRGIPQVVGPGALDMVNFGPRSTVPDRFRDRLFHVHNANVTLMRTTIEENAELGERIASILSRAKAAATVMLPLKGISALDAPGFPFFDPEADAALFDAIESGLKGSTNVRVIKLDLHINDPQFADASVNELINML